MRNLAPINLNVDAYLINPTVSTRIPISTATSAYSSILLSLAEIWFPTPVYLSV